MQAERHPREAERLEALRSYEILDTPPEAELDDLVALAARICETPVALVSLVAEDRQWFKAAVGMERQSLRLNSSMCAQTILGRELMEVADLSADERFECHPYVVNAPHARFYAGVPLETPEGLPLGTFCVLDVQPRELNELQRETLRVLARQATTHLELRRRMRELNAERARVESTLELAGVATWAWDGGSDHVRSNPLLRRFFGLPPDDAVNVPLLDFLLAIHRDDRERISAAIGDAVQSGSPYETEYRVLDGEGTQRWVLARGNAVPGMDALAGVLVDVTARRELEQALTAERAQFRRLLDEVPAHIVTLMGPELRYEFANRSFIEFIGSSDFLGKRADEAWRVPEDHLAMLRGILATGQPVTGREVLVVSPAGQARYFDFAFQPLREADGSVAGVFIHSLDVTERVQARQALTRSEERFRAAQETTPDAFTILESVRDEAGTIVDFRWVYMNPAAEAMAETTREELLGASVLEKRPRLKTNGRFDLFSKIAEGGEPYSDVIPLNYLGQDRHVAMTVIKVGDGVATHFRDVTESVQTEERLRQAVTERTQELQEAVAEAERFNYSISHDLRTPLRAIASTAQVLLEDAGPGLRPEHRELLERQGSSARRLGLLIDQLLRLSRLGRVEMAPVTLDMTAIARSVADEIIEAGNPACAIEVQEGMRAEGDPALVRLVFANLLENACKFSKGEGTVRVTQDGDTFHVSDEGVGFDMRYASKLFLPFERLVSEGDFPGTGIGLANVERIVRRHGGRIGARSDGPGRGATFSFTLS